MPGQQLKFTFSSTCESCSGFPGGIIGKEPACQCRKRKRCRFDPGVRKIPWKRAQQLIPVFLPGRMPCPEKLGRLQSIALQRIRHYWSNLACMHAWELLSIYSLQWCEFSSLFECDLGQFKMYGLPFEGSLYLKGVQGRFWCPAVMQ